MARHINDIIASRRALLGGLVGIPLLDLAACATPPSSAAPSAAAAFASVAPTNADTVSLPPGYSWRSLIAWGDALFEGIPDAADLDALTRADQERRFGQNNDMLALFAGEYTFPPPKTQDLLILCANNEYASLELTYPALASSRDVTAAQVEALYAAVGVSVVDLARDGAGWRAVKSNATRGRNRRVTPFSPAVFTGPAAQHPWIVAAAEKFNAAEPAGPSAVANEVRCGTGANCAGGLTPWGTVRRIEAATGDELIDVLVTLIVAHIDSDTAIVRQRRRGALILLAPKRGALLRRRCRIVRIDLHDPAIERRPARIVREIELSRRFVRRRPVTRVSERARIERQRRVFELRCAIEIADEQACAANMDLLDEGQLYCAQFDENGGGRWIPITLDAANAAAEAEDSPIRFRDEADLLVRVRDAARFLGATPMDRPEDIEAVCDANWCGLGPVLIACTNNSERGFAHPGNPRREDAERPYAAQSNLAGHVLRIDEAGGDVAATTFTWDIFAMGGDPSADRQSVRTRGGGAPAFISTNFAGAPTISGDRFACPDNLFIDSTHRAWIATDGSDAIFEDCNDCIMMTPVAAERPRPMKRFLVGPMGAEICGPLMAPDERAFFCSIQHPGANDVAGIDYSVLRWQGVPPTSHFPDGGEAWPRSAVVVITRDDGGRIGD